MNYAWNVYMSFLNPALPMHILLRRFLMEWNEGNGVHTYSVPPPAWLGPVPERRSARSRVGKTKEAACGSGKFKRGGTKNGGGKQTDKCIDGLRFASLPVPTLSLEHAQQVVRIPLEAGGKI